MATVANESAGNDVWLPKSRAEHQKITAQMELILASQHFSQSKRSQLLFRYIVAKTLSGQVSILKERTLGVEVFNRAPEYDTNADPIVRMTAGEIRKRIAQYYHDSAHSDEVRIDLPSGTYVAQFHLPRAENEPHEAASETPIISLPHEISHDASAETVGAVPAAHVRPNRNKLLWLIPAILFVALIALYLVVARRPSSSIDLAWGNILADKSPALISLGEPKPYSNADWTSNQSSLTAREHVSTNSVSYSEVQALVRITRLLDTEKVLYRVQVSSGTTFGDLRQSPAVLLGGLNNPWTMRAQQNLRYQLATDGNGVDWIIDARDPNAKKYIVDLKLPYQSLTNDYAIVARFHDPTTQEPVLIVAGLGENGTKAASEFITDEKPLQEALGLSLRTSNGKNFEVVLGTQVINGVSGPPKVLAKEIW